MQPNTHADMLIGLEKSMLDIYHDLASALPPCIELRHPYSCSTSVTGDSRVTIRRPPEKIDHGGSGATANGSFGHDRAAAVTSKQSEAAESRQADILEDLPLAKRLRIKTSGTPLQHLTLSQRLQMRSVNKNAAEESNHETPLGSSTAAMVKPGKKAKLQKSSSPVAKKIDGISPTGQSPLEESFHSAGVSEQPGSFLPDQASLKPRKPRPPRKKKEIPPTVAPLRPLLKVLQKCSRGVQSIGKVVTSTLDHPVGGVPSGDALQNRGSIDSCFIDLSEVDEAPRAVVEEAPPALNEAHIAGSARGEAPFPVIGGGTKEKAHAVETAHEVDMDNEAFSSDQGVASSRYGTGLSGVLEASNISSGDDGEHRVEDEGHGGEIPEDRSRTRQMFQEEDPKVVFSDLGPGMASAAPCERSAPTVFEETAAIFGGWGEQPCVTQGGPQSENDVPLLHTRKAPAQSRHIDNDEEEPITAAAEDGNERGGYNYQADRCMEACFSEERTNTVGVTEE